MHQAPLVPAHPRPEPCGGFRHGDARGLRGREPRAIRRPAHRSASRGRHRRSLPALVRFRAHAERRPTRQPRTEPSSSRRPSRAKTRSPSTTCPPPRSSRRTSPSPAAVLRRIKLTAGWHRLQPGTLSGSSQSRRDPTTRRCLAATSTTKPRCVTSMSSTCPPQPPRTDRPSRRAQSPCGPCRPRGRAALSAQPPGRRHDQRKPRTTGGEQVGAARPPLSAGRCTASGRTPPLRDAKPGRETSRVMLDVQRMCSLV